ncbi:MAG: hypothetical protein AB9856_06990 [Cellulosilyticaceae bacterium]
MRKINSKFQTQFISEAGKQLYNKDYFAFVELDKFACYVLADGIDQDTEAISAQIVVTSIIRNFTENPTINAKKLKRYVDKANRELKETKSNARLKASLTIVVTDYMKARYLLVGNTRFYLIRNGRIWQKSNDQSLTSVLVKDAQIPQDKIAQHEERNNLYCYLGQDHLLKPYCSKKIKLVDSDLWILMTKGIWQYCDDGEILDAASEVKKAEELIDNVEELILSKQPKDLEDYTVATTFVDKIYRKPNKKITLKKVLLTLIPILLVVAIVGTGIYMKHRQKQNRIQIMKEHIQSAIQYVANDNYEKASEDYKEALKLAQKLKLNEEKEDLDHKQKLVDQLIQADKLYQEGKYKEALEAYIGAKELARKADQIGKEYIDAQLEKSREHLDVLELLTDGDQKMDLHDIEEAKKDYMAAKALANELYFEDGKKQATEKLNQITSQKAEQEKAKKEDEKEKKEAEKTQKEEEKVQKEAEKLQQQEKEAKENQKRQDQIAALEMEQKASSSYTLASYQDAKMYYLIAKELYQQCELYEKSEDIEKKLQVIETKLTEVASKRAKADAYMESANTLVEKKKYVESQLLYKLASEIYEKIPDEVQVKKIEEKIALLKKLEED